MKRGRKPVLGRIQLSDGTVCVVRDRAVHALLQAQSAEIERLRAELAAARRDAPGRIVIPSTIH